MLIKLTYYGTGKPTLVNLESVETMFQVVDKYKNRLSTKILFKGGNFINVDEELQDVLKIQSEMMNGRCQDFDWQSPTIDELLETDFYRQQSKPKRDWTRNERVINNY